MRNACVLLLMMGSITFATTVLAKPDGEVIGNYRGVAAYSNGSNTGSSAGKREFQCIPLVKRYWSAIHSDQKLPEGIITGRDLWEAGKKLGFVRAIDNGKASAADAPDEGDILIWENHAAIACAARTDLAATASLRVFEQNVDADTAFRIVTLRIDQGRYLIESGRGLIPLGWLKVASTGPTDGQPAKPPTPAPPIVPLLIDEGFEDAAGGRSAWTLDTWRKSRTAGQVVDDVAHTGTHSLRLTTKDPDDIRHYRRIEVAQDAKYRLSGWIKTDDVRVSERGGSRGANLCLYEIGNNGDTSASATGTADWKPFELVFNSGSRREVAIGLRLGHYGSTSTGTAWFDDIKLERLDRPSNPQRSPLAAVSPTSPKVFPFLGYWKDFLGRILVLRGDGTGTYGFPETPQAMKWSMTTVKQTSAISVPLDFVRYHGPDRGQAMDPANPANTYLTYSEPVPNGLNLRREEGNVVSFGFNRSTEGEIDGLLERAKARVNQLKRYSFLGYWLGDGGTRLIFTPGLVTTNTRLTNGAPATLVRQWYPDDTRNDLIYIKSSQEIGTHYVWGFGAAKDNLVLRHYNKPQNQFTGDVIAYRRADNNLPSQARSPRLLGSWGTRFMIYRFEANGTVTARSPITGQSLDGQWRSIGGDVIDIRFPAPIDGRPHITEYAWKLVAEGKVLRLTPTFPKQDASMEFDRQ